MKESGHLSIKNIASMGIITAVICILAPLSIPIGPVPVSLTNLVIFFGIYILGWEKGTISYIVYLLIGLVGVPVFSGFTAGPQKLLGPTGGYLIGFILMAVISGLFIEKSGRKFILSFIGMITGMVVCYVLETAWLAFQMHLSIQAALVTGVLPFLLGDLLKMILAALVAPQIYKALQRADLLSARQQTNG